MALLLAEELVLLDRGLDLRAYTRIGYSAGYALAGALLADLAERGRLDCPAGKVMIIDRSATTHPVLDEVLHRVAAAPGDQPPARWVAQLEKHAFYRTDGTASYWRQLEAAMDNPAGGAQTATQPGADIAARLRQVFDAGPEPDEHAVTLAGLLGACGLARFVFRTVDPALRKRRLAEVTAGQWAVSGVRSAVRRANTGDMVGGLLDLLRIGP